MIRKVVYKYVYKKANYYSNKDKIRLQISIKLNKLSSPLSELK